MGLNLSSDWYFTQRNNHIRPAAACMPTARAMFYHGNGIAYHSDPMKKLADDDYFMSLLNSQSAISMAKVKYPWAVGENGMLSIPPNEIHGMYHSWLDHKVCGRRTSNFRTDLTVDDYIEAMERGEVIMTSGAFPESHLAGHAFCIIGFDGKNFRLADPWGDWTRRYRIYGGYDIEMSKDEFIEHVKPVGSEKKWGHVII